MGFGEEEEGKKRKKKKKKATEGGGGGRVRRLEGVRVCLVKVGDYIYII